MQKCIFRQKILILSDNPVSITHVVWKKRRLFVRIKLMQLGFSGFLKHAGCLMTLCKEQLLQNFCIASSSTHALKSPRSTIFLYLVKHASNHLLMHDIKMFSNVTLVGVIRGVNKLFHFIQAHLNKKAFCRRKFIAWQFGWYIFSYVKENSSTISITVKFK